MRYCGPDYLQDTRCLTPAGRGIWNDILLYMHAGGETGDLELSPLDWSRQISATIEEVMGAILEIGSKGVGDVYFDREFMTPEALSEFCPSNVRENSVDFPSIFQPNSAQCPRFVRVVNRRMHRAYLKKEKDRLRKIKEREGKKNRLVSESGPSPCRAVCPSPSYSTKNKSTKTSPPISPPLPFPDSDEIPDGERSTMKSPPPPFTKGGSEDSVRGRNTLFPKWENLPDRGGGKEYPEGFERFWKLNPRVDKRKSYERWCKIIKAKANGSGPGPPAETLIQALEAYLAECRADRRFKDGRTAKNLETWLNGTWEQYWGRTAEDVEQEAGGPAGREKNKYDGF